ncbi:MAG: hypothetical protein NVSMB6_14450 [Burkholderiaceae bacterium]
MIIGKSKRREHVLQQAGTVFGRAGAIKWMASEVRSLGHVTPDSLLETEAGYQRVINVLEKIEYEVPCWYL